MGVMPKRGERGHCKSRTASVSLPSPISQPAQQAKKEGKKDLSVVVITHTHTVVGRRRRTRVFSPTIEPIVHTLSNETHPHTLESRRRSVRREPDPYPRTGNRCALSCGMCVEKTNEKENSIWLQQKKRTANPKHSPATHTHTRKRVCFGGKERKQIDTHTHTQQRE